MCKEFYSFKQVEFIGGIIKGGEGLKPSGGDGLQNQGDGDGETGIIQRGEETHITTCPENSFYGIGGIYALVNRRRIFQERPVQVSIRDLKWN